jgi:hypothetical protein
MLFSLRSDDAWVEPRIGGGCSVIRAGNPEKGSLRLASSMLTHGSGVSPGGAKITSLAFLSVQRLVISYHGVSLPRIFSR